MKEIKELLEVKNKRIIIDFDDTIVNSSKAIYEMYCDHKKVEKNYNPNHGWGWEGLITKEDIIKYDIYNYFLTEEFTFKYIKIFESFLDTLVRLSVQNNTIIICTRNHPERQQHTSRFLEQNSIMQFINGVFFVDSFNKGKFLESNKDTIVIDDKIECLNSFSDECTKICYGDYQWNEEWEGLYISSWKELFN